MCLRRDVAAALMTDGESMAFRAEPWQHPQPQVCEFDLRIEPCGQYVDHLSASCIRAKRDGRCERSEDNDDCGKGNRGGTPWVPDAVQSIHRLGVFINEVPGQTWVHPVGPTRQRDGQTEQWNC